MATQKDLDFTYSTIDQIFRLSMGETADFSGAMYNGNFSLSLEEAQRAKHEFIADSLGINKGSKVLDMGCGWGPFSRFVQERGGESTGLTLSQGQVEACRKNGLTVHLKDCRYVHPGDYGIFDAVSCVGAFEHFCSIEDWKAGKQEKIYHDFFRAVYNLLPKGGRFYLQTMVFGRNMIDFEDIDIKAQKGSAAHVMALMVKEFPGSWLPYGLEMVVRNADPFFKVVSKSSGRLDYIETIRQWRRRFRTFNLKKYWLYLTLVPNFFTDEEFRHRVSIFRISPNKICFEKEIMDHYRIVLEKK
ncbi:SAM-dependent methyltransferase [Negadavirga shengliensis]|uniref:SAM-dependent methyltransferase n=1 Tax=Negadavirga shengliensis TaxID=1389218 RepID=A0ABV9SZX0_9BACT